LPHIWIPPDNRYPKVAVFSAQCITGKCYLLIYTRKSRSVIVIVPPQPTPYCTRYFDKIDTEIVSLVLSSILNTPPSYISMCIVSKEVMKQSLSETINQLVELGIVHSINNQ